MRGALLAVVAALTVAFAGCGGDDKGAASSTPSAETAATTPTETAPASQVEPPAADISGIAQSGVTLGAEDAPVTLYEFADLQCPFCRDFSVNEFPRLVDQYVRPGKVKIVFRNLTFVGRDSVTAARAAGAAGKQNKLWDFVDTFYANQAEENSGYVTDAFIAQIAAGAGVDAAQLKADMGSPDIEKQLGEAQKMAAQFGVDSTPTFLIQRGESKPQPYGGAPTAEALSAKLDAALK